MLCSFQPLVLLALIHLSYDTRLHIYQLSPPAESHMLVYYQVLTHGRLHAAIINSDIMESLIWYNDRYNTGKSGKSKLVSRPTHMCLPARNGLVNEVEFLEVIAKKW